MSYLYRFVLWRWLEARNSFRSFKIPAIWSAPTQLLIPNDCGLCVELQQKSPLIDTGHETAAADDWRFSYNKIAAGKRAGAAAAKKKKENHVNISSAAAYGQRSFFDRQRCWPTKCHKKENIQVECIHFFLNDLLMY